MNDLLKVLDMSKDEQNYWTMENTDRGIRGGHYESLADLAFRLRDEALDKDRKYEKAMQVVCDYVYKYESSKGEIVSYYAAFIAKPIHWIIAALKVKEQIVSSKGK